MAYIFLGQHLAHIGTAGGIADQGRAVADQCDWLVSCHLQALHQAKRHEVSNMKGVSRAVKADVKSCFAIVDHLADFIFVRDLGNQSAGHQFFVNSRLHFYTSL